MLVDHDSPEEDAKKIVDTLGSHKETFTHAKHIHMEECHNLGIKVAKNLRTDLPDAFDVWYQYKNINDNELVHIKNEE